MADGSDRTEAPTPKRRREARRKGQVARSPYLGGWAALLGVMVALPDLGRRLVDGWEGIFATAATVMGHPSAQAALRLLGASLSESLWAVVPVGALAGGVALAATVGQVGVGLSPKALWSPSRLSPTAGARRLVSAQGAWTLLRTLGELCVLAGLGYLTVHQVVAQLLEAGPMPLQAATASAVGVLAALGRDVAGAGLLISLGDWAFQRRRVAQSLRMTKTEVKEERRQSEGSPEARSALRRRQRQLSRRRMMAEVAKATAVVTNPTHLSVALAYERGVDIAPRVVAKGLGATALAIRREARRNGVPVVENPRVAWTIHGTCEEGDLVPPELYRVVAAVIAFVYSLSPTARSLLDSHVMP